MSIKLLTRQINNIRGRLASQFGELRPEEVEEHLNRLRQTEAELGHIKRAMSARSLADYQKAGVPV